MSKLRNNIVFIILLILFTILIIIRINQKKAVVVEKKISEINLVVSIDWGELPDDFSLIGDVAQYITVKVKGEDSILEKLAGNDIIYKPDVSGISSGSAFFEIDPSKFQLPVEVEIVNMSPSVLSFKLEKIMEKEIPVKLSLIGDPSDDFILSESYVNPGKIFLKGPEHVLKNIDFVSTNDIALIDIKESFVKEIPLNLDETTSPLASRKIVNVSVTLTDKNITNVFRKLTVKGYQTKHKYKIRPASVDLTVEGPARIVKNLNPQKDIHVYINLKNLKPGVYARRVKVKLPSGASLLDVNPEVFTVAINGK